MVRGTYSDVYQLYSGKRRAMLRPALLPLPVAPAAGSATQEGEHRHPPALTGGARGYGTSAAAASVGTSGDFAAIKDVIR